MGKLLQMPLLFEAFLDLDEPETNDASGSHLSPATPELPVQPAMIVADSDQREAALDIHRSWIVEAPAGSGKTGLLIQRYLRLLAEGGVEQPEEVLAITFTRKAGAEMRHRVLEQLTAAQNAEPLGPIASPFDRRTRQLAEAALARDRSLGWRLLESPQQLNIRTIDSFCAELAGSTPLLAGPGGRYAPTDDPGPLYELAAERTLLRMGGPDASLTRDLEELLLHRDAQPGDLKRLLAEMLRQRDQWGELVPLHGNKLTNQALDQEVRPRLDRTLQRLVGRELARVADAIGPHLLSRLAALGHEFSALPGYKEGPSPLASCSERPGPPASAADDLPRWLCLKHLLISRDGSWRQRLNKGILGFEGSKAHWDELQDLIAAFNLRNTEMPGLLEALCDLESLPDGTFPDDQWHVVKALCRVLYRALLELQLLFAERQTCDFSEVALTARSLLRSEQTGSDLLHTMVGRLRHLLVDEMQDTSAGQYELLEGLTASWDGATQTVFLVGDPKQSIYEFRQARVERFRRVMEEQRFAHIAVGALRLTANFRSQAVLVEALNDTFRALLPTPEELSGTSDAVDVPFVAAAATRSAGDDPALHWHVLAGPFTRGNVDTSTQESSPFGSAAAEHAHTIRQTIECFLEAWAERPVQTGKPARAPKVAVLGRNRTHLAPVIHEFHQDRGRGSLPFSAVEIEALNERPEVLDLFALTRALLDPGDRVAWLAVLRSPLCGLSLDDLLALTGEGSSADPDATVPLLIAHRGHLLSQEGQALLARTWVTLDVALRNLGRTSFSTHLERTWRSVGGDAPLGPSQRTNARRYLRLLSDLEAGLEPLTANLVRRRLKTLHAEPEHPDAAVELMTIHKAKGLEWDLVLLPALQGGSGRNGQHLLKWLEFDGEEGHGEFLLAPISSKGDDSSKLSKWLDRRQRQREQAEAKRLFYVACTRAREELHLFATVDRKADGTLAPPNPASSLLAAAWPAAESRCNELLGAPRPADLEHSVSEFEHASEPLALAAVASAAVEINPIHQQVEPPQSPAGIEARRLPLSFNALLRLAPLPSPRLPYPSPGELPNRAVFTRPEGSFSARAFGNVVHRMLHLLSTRLQQGQTMASLQAELSSWLGRVLVALRSEGLAREQATAEATRVLHALEAALGDPEGAWLLLPQRDARNESPVPSTDGVRQGSLRADRTFIAGSAPLSEPEPGYLWVIDYKTAELGGRTRESFLNEEKQKYAAQMQAYADAAIAAGNPPDRLILALYFPLLPALVYWPAQVQVAPL